MPLSDKYRISGIIYDSRDRKTGQPRKRIVAKFPNSSTTHGLDIPASTKDNPGQLRRAACDILGISMDEVYVTNVLKRIIAGKG